MKTCNLCKIFADEIVGFLDGLENNLLYTVYMIYLLLLYRWIRHCKGRFENKFKN